MQRADSGCCVPAGMSCPRFTPAVRFCRRALRSLCARHCVSPAASCPRFTPAVLFCGAPCVHCAPIIAFLSPRIALGSRLLFALRQTGRLAVSRVPVPPGSRSPFVRSRSVGAVICLGGFTSGLAVSLWRSRRSYRGRGERSYEGDGAGGAALVRLCAATLALQCFPRGVRWGCAPQTAPTSLRLSGLSSGAGSAALVRLYAAALALPCFPRGVRWGCAPQTAPKSHWLSGLSSRCGWVALVRNRRAVARAYGNPCPAPISRGRSRYS